MQIKSCAFLSLVAATLVVTGCAGPEQKLGRGIVNMTEFTRLGEMNRSVEQAGIFAPAPEVAYSTGVIHGFNQSVKRTFVGFYEVLTFPIPNRCHGDYGPVLLPEHPLYPDSYRPRLIADQIVSPDSSLGFGGGDVAPYIPGSRFRVFDN